MTDSEAVTDEPSVDPERENQRFEIAAAVLLGLATIAIAWGAYQANLWGGRQDKAQRIIDKNLPDISDKKVGTVFECAYARFPEGCGRTTHCSGCTIRRSVNDTYETGRPHKNVQATLKYAEDPDSETVKMLISTEKIKDVVFLRYDMVEEKND